MANEDKDLSSIDAMPDPDAQPTAPAQGDAVATAIQNTAVGIGTASDGKAPEAVAADAAAAATAVRNLAADAVVIGDAVRILKKAAAEWRKNAPKKKELDDAQKAVDDAKKALATAQQAEDDSLSDSAKALAKQQVKTASDALDKAVLNLQTLQKKRKDADEAFDREHKKAVAKLKGLNRATHDGDSPVVPGAGTGTQSTGAGTGSGSPSARTAGSGTPAAKPGGTPAATPGSGKPAETPTTSTPTSKPDPGIASLLSSLNQQNQQQPQQTQAAQPATAQPTAVAPQAAQQSGQQGQNKKQEGVIDTEDIARELGETPGTIVAGLGGTHSSTSSSSSPSPTPAVQQNTTALRPDFKPASLAAAAAQNPVTSGQSATGLTTPSDVGGRSTPTAGAFDSPKTTTSAAHADAAQQQNSQQQTGRPMGSGMPGMMPLAPGAAGPSYGSPATKDKDGKVIAYGGNPQSLILNGWPALEDSVQGGTICRALQQDNQARISV